MCQHGSRHRYAIPRMLEGEGALTALYTDSSVESFMGKVAARKGVAGGLDRWVIDGVPREKIYSSDAPHVYELIKQRFAARGHKIKLYQRRHQILSNKMRRWGVGDANTVYSMYHENLDFLRHAKSQGLMSVVDVFVSPITDRVMEEESVRFPDWALKSDQDAAALLDQLWVETAELADMLLCPSEWVAEGVRHLSPEAAEKIRIVPYGCSMTYGERVNEPVKGRVLFAGRDALRKGLHDLGRAALALKDDPSVELDVRVAGPMPDEVVNHSVCSELNFLGSLSRERMIEEYLSADLLALPALSEGFAGVVAEAIGAGCPVVVTKETGSPVIHEREGLITPSRDPDALATSIKRVVTDRGLRDSMSAACIAQRPFYSETSWSARLMGAIQDGLRQQKGVPA